MRQKAKITAARRNQSGNVGVRVDLDLDENGWAGHYAFMTHGKTPVEVTAERDRIVAYHTKKATRLAETNTTERTFQVRGSDFFISAWTVMDRGTDAELFLRIDDVATGEHVEIRRVSRIDDVPAADEVIALARDAAASYLDALKASRDHLNGVEQALVAPLIAPIDAGNGGVL